MQVVDIRNKDTILHTTVYPKQNDDAETVLLLHGGPGAPEEYAQVREKLNGKFRVINFQQRGIGESHNPSRDYSMEGYISDISAIGDHFKLEKFHLFGQSWGGLYAQIYANAHPERVSSLFLSSPSSGTNDLWKDTEKEVLNYNQENSSDIEFMKMGIYSLFGMMGFDWGYQKMFQLVLTVYNRTYCPELEIDFESFKAIKTDPINKTRPAIQNYKPLPEVVEDPPFQIMLTYGDADIYGPSSEKSLARYPSAKIQIIKDCGHIPWLHNPVAFDAILNEFYALAK